MHKRSIMKWSTIRLSSLVAGTLCVISLGLPASAAGDSAPLTGAKWPHATTTPSALAGFIDANFPSVSSLQYNSSGGPVTLSQSATGVYQVVFAGLGAITGGNVEISAEDEVDTCAVGNWTSTGGNLDVSVDCYNYAGVADNAIFSLIVTQPTTAPHGALAYDWNYNSTASYAPGGVYQYNSAHTKNYVTHLGTGQYKVTMPGVGTTGTSGTVKVSAYGAGGGDCQLLNWSGTAAGAEVIYVNCYSASGARQNRQFDVVYAKSNNLMGQNGLIDGNVLASKPGIPAYLPKTQYLSRSGAVADLAEDSPTSYQVLFAALQAHPGVAPGADGNVQVTAQGSSYAHCVAWEYNAQYTPVVAVACVNNSGFLVKSKFTIQWVSTP